MDSVTRSREGEQPLVPGVGLRAESGVPVQQRIQLLGRASESA
jgi:hypothetical protein